MRPGRNLDVHPTLICFLEPISPDTNPDLLLFFPNSSSRLWSVLLPFIFCFWLLIALVFGVFTQLIFIDFSLVLFCHLWAWHVTKHWNSGLFIKFWTLPQVECDLLIRHMFTYIYLTYAWIIKYKKLCLFFNYFHYQVYLFFFFFFLNLCPFIWVRLVFSGSFH